MSIFQNMRIKKEDQIKEKWLAGYDEDQRWDRDYREYLNDLFSKDGIKAVGMSYDAFLAIRENKRLEELEKKRQKRLHRVANSRIKLTNAEKYLASAARISKVVYLREARYNDINKTADKTPSEIRRDINKMRKKPDYQGYKDLNDKLKAGMFSAVNSLDALSVLIRELQNSTIGYNVVNNALYSSSEHNDLMAFVLAEDKIKGLSEQEIEKLYMIEQL